MFADVVLGADGIKSAVRGYITGEDPRKWVAFSNYTTFRGLVKPEDLAATGAKTDFAQRMFVILGQHRVSVTI